MLRTKRTRYPAIRYLAKRIPSDEKKAKDAKITVSNYTIEIFEREVSLVKDQYRK